ncbi:MAG: 4-hydroxybenzoate octaprenyltransferase [Gemmataceae bacterium]|nr:4-hydroxybenzoate octaprenyltransferase [Gemmataceae bacterium]
MLQVIRRLLEMIRFSHTLFALPFALLSAALAWSREPFRIVDLVGILSCMILARSAAMAFNRLVDRRIDAQNPRTAGRHLPAGSLSVGTVILFTAACSAGFVASTLLFVLREEPNWWPLYLSGPVLLFICAYSLTKRFTALAHFWLGASLMLAPLSAWIAILGLSDLLTPALVGGAVFFWVAGFDILYACQDVDFDRVAKLHSVPAWLGVRASLRLALGCHAVMIGFLVALYLMTPELGSIWLIGLIAVGILLAYEHWLVRPDDLSRVNKAFFQVNAVVSVGLFVLVLVQLAAR